MDRDAESVTLSGDYISIDNPGRREYWGGFYAIVNGQRYDETLEYQTVWGFEGHYKSDSFTTVTIPLSEGEDEEVVSIEIRHVDPNAIPETYTLRIKKSDPVPVDIKAIPGDLLVFMTSDLTGKREYEDSNGIFMLTPGRTYSYNATKYGYIGQTGKFTVPQGGGSLEITLVQAPANGTIQNLPAQWPHLRTDNNNNGVINAPTPVSSDDAVLYWATKIGDGFDQNDEDQFVPRKLLDEAKPGQAQYEAIDRALYGPYVLPKEVMFYGRVRTTDSVWGKIGRHIFCYENGYLATEHN